MGIVYTRQDLDRRRSCDQMGVADMQSLAQRLPHLGAEFDDFAFLRTRIVENRTCKFFVAYLTMPRQTRSNVSWTCVAKVSS
jgi:hypothetical protein